MWRARRALRHGSSERKAQRQLVAALARRIKARSGEMTPALAERAASGIRRGALVTTSWRNEVQIGLRDVGGRRCASAFDSWEQAPLRSFLQRIGANIELVEPFLMCRRTRRRSSDAPGVGSLPAPILPYRPSTLAPAERPATGSVGTRAGRTFWPVPAARWRSTRVSAEPVRCRRPCWRLHRPAT